MNKNYEIKYKRNRIVEKTDNFLKCEVNYLMLVFEIEMVFSLQYKNSIDLLNNWLGKEFIYYNEKHFSNLMLAWWNNQKNKTYHSKKYLKRVIIYNHFLKFDIQKTYIELSKFYPDSSDSFTYFYRNFKELTKNRKTLHVKLPQNNGRRNK